MAPVSGTDLLLICALGNPDRKYLKTRHNAGFVFADRFIKVNKFPPFKKCEKLHGEITAGHINDRNTIVLKPLTYMNRSGIALARALNFFNVRIEDIIIVHDDIDFEFGNFRIKRKGGNGGHNGIRSIENELGTDSFTRLRLGIGKPSLNMETADYVLSNFLDDEWTLIDNSLCSTWNEIMIKIITEGIEEAMNVFNRRSK